MTDSPQNDTQPAEATSTMPDDTTEEKETSEQPQETMSSDDSELAAQIIALQEEAAANLQGWQRSRAEFTNYKRRTTQQLSDARQAGALDALGKMLPIIDDFERALDNVPDDLEGHPWLNGTALILKNMQKVLDSYEIETLDPVGEEFDPTMHEAIGTDDSSEYDSGIVTTTLQKGYKSGDHIIRPALVRVAN